MAGFKNKTDTETYQKGGGIKVAYSPRIDFLPFEHISMI